MQRACDRAANDDRRVSFPGFPVKPDSMYFVSCPKQDLEMEAVVLHRVGFLENFCPKQGQDFKPSAAPLCPNMGHVPPLPGVCVQYHAQLKIEKLKSLW